MANLTDIGYGVGKYLEASDASAIPDIGTNRKNLDLLNFKVATNNAYALYNFKDGMIDAYVDETGVDAGTSTNETYNAAGDYYSGRQSETFNPWAHGTVAHGSYVSLSISDTRGTFTANDSPLVVAWENAGNSTGVYTVVWTLVQVAGGGSGGPNHWPMIAKNSYADWADSSGYANSYGAYFGGWNKNSSVGWKVKFVYDTDDEDVLLAYADTGSGYVAQSITYGANWASTTLSTLYWANASWDDGYSPDWIVDFTSGTREYPANMTLISNAQTSLVSDPTEGRLMIYEETSTGSTTLDTDLKGYVSRDGGTTYTPTPLTLDTTYETGKNISFWFSRYFWTTIRNIHEI